MHNNKSIPPLNTAAQCPQLPVLAHLTGLIRCWIKRFFAPNLTPGWFPAALGNKLSFEAPGDCGHCPGGSWPWSPRSPGVRDWLGSNQIQHCFKKIAKYSYLPLIGQADKVNKPYEASHKTLGWRGAGAVIFPGHFSHRERSPWSGSVWLVITGRGLGLITA